MGKKFKNVIDGQNKKQLSFDSLGVWVPRCSFVIENIFDKNGDRFRAVKCRDVIFHTFAKCDIQGLNVKDPESNSKRNDDAANFTFTENV